ncbi:MAG: hypothetical protein OEQ53_22130, partial [Saprospiraceae bacterium]|nr:hypothetical protein [Saprospiraceae bacterium]
TYGFQKNESEIIQYSMPEIIYSVEQLSDTILTLAAQIQNADFQLDLRRLSDQEEARQVTEN